MKLEFVIVNDEPMLFSEDRKADKKAKSKGLFVYNMRESDGELATIEKGDVVVDWGGSLISKNDAIDFGDSDFIDITDINKDYMYPDYIGYEMTIDDYINNFDLIRFLIRGYEYY